MLSVQNVKNKKTSQTMKVGKMNVPDEWLEEVVEKLKENYRMFQPFARGVTPEMTEKMQVVLNEYMTDQFNSNFRFNPNLEDKFHNFFVGIMAHQCLMGFHPLTCGVGGGSHKNLMPRIHDDGETYLVCPTCGWIQNNAPRFF